LAHPFSDPENANCAAKEECPYYTQEGCQSRFVTPTGRCKAEKSETTKGEKNSKGVVGNLRRAEQLVLLIQILANLVLAKTTTGDSFACVSQTLRANRLPAVLAHRDGVEFTMVEAFH